MATFSKSYTVGDTVYVFYRDVLADFFTPQERVVKQIKGTAAGNTATVTFESGADVVDTDATTTIYTTQALCATAIIDEVITRADATANLDPTLSAASTAGNTTLSLGRIDT